MRLTLVVLCATLALACSGRASTPGAAQPEGEVLDPNQMPILRLGNASEPVAYQLQMQIDADKSAFRGEVVIDIEIHTPLHTLWLNQRGLMITEANLLRGGLSTKLEASVPQGGHELLKLESDRELGVGPAQIHIAFKGHFGDVSGLFHQVEGGRWYAYTDFEANDARAAFPCYDDPRFKVVWNIEIETPAEQLAFANTREVERTSMPSGHQRFRFAETRPLPSYLVAMAAGPFSTIEGKASETTLRIIAPANQAEEGRFVLTNTDTWMRYLENYLAMKMPYDKLDFIAVPHFSGAMENPGLVTFSSNILLIGSGASDASKRLAAGVTAHELAHLWFGDLLTPHYWEDLWLNEGFATWLSDKVVASWQPERAREILDIADKSSAFEHDHSLYGRRVREPITGAADIRAAFDAITYRKGGAILTMLEAWLGESRMRKAVRSYAATFADRSVNAKALIAELEESTGEKKLGGFFASFLGQTGIPLIRATLNCEGKPSVELEQSRYLPLHTRPGQESADLVRHWKLPVCLRYPGARGDVRHCEFIERSTTRVFLRVESCPDWLLPNDADSGYYHYQLPVSGFAALGTVELDSRERLGLVHSIVALQRSGALGLSESLRLLEVHALAGDAAVQEVLIPMLYRLQRSLVDEALRPAFAAMVRRWYGARVAKLGMIERLGESSEDRQLRPLLIKAQADLGEDMPLRKRVRDAALQWLDSVDFMTPDLLSSWLETTALDGDAALLEGYRSGLRRAKDRRISFVLVAAMHSFRDPALLETSLRGTLSKGQLPEFLVPSLVRTLGDAALRPMILRLFEEHREGLMNSAQEGAFAKIAPVFAGLCDAESRDFVERFAGGESAAQATLDAISGCILFRTEQSAGAERHWRAPSGAPVPPVPPDPG